MKKKSVQQYKWMLCLFLLIRMSETRETSETLSQNELNEDLNGNARLDEEDLLHSEDNDLNERQNVIKSVLHNQLENVTHEEQFRKLNTEGPEYNTQQLQKFNRYAKNSVGDNNNDEDNEYENEDDNEDNNEEEEREFNPWQDSFQDRYADGTYVFGYSLPNGVTKYERSFYSEIYKGRVTEGFYTQPRYFGGRILYELRCYRADYFTGYKVLPVRYLRRPPIVRRDKKPNVNCFYKS